MINKYNTALLAALFSLMLGIAHAEPVPILTAQRAGQVCPSGKHDAEYPGVPENCIICAAPGCEACHSERTDKTVEASKKAQENCPPVKPH